MEYDRTILNVNKPYHLDLLDYKDYLVYDRQLSQGTANTYIFGVSKFADFISKSLKEVSREDVRDFLRSLRTHNRKTSTIANYIASLRSYYEYLANLEKSERLSVLCFFLAKIIRIKIEKSVPMVPTSQEVRRLRETMRAFKYSLSPNRQPGHYKIVLRDMAVLEMMIGTGARSAEIRAIRVTDIDFIADTVFIKKGKGGHQRVAIFSGTSQLSVKDHILHNNLKDNDLVFPMGQGNLLGYIIRRWAKRAGVNPRLHAHSFRHYHITESRRNGIDIQTVADQSGHSSLNTTRHYTHLGIEHRREEYKKLEL